MATSSFKLLLSPLFANITSVFLQERKKQSPKYSNKPHSELIYNIKHHRAELFRVRSKIGVLASLNFEATGFVQNHAGKTVGDIK